MNADFSIDTDAFAGFSVGRQANQNNRGGIAADNFLVIPEPGSLALLATGLLGLFALRRRR